MTADFESWLKKAWENMTCPGETCKDMLPEYNDKFCEGHAALLRMVDAVHVQGCKCDRSFPVKCQRERRRLRASIGVSDD